MTNLTVTRTTQFTVVSCCKCGIEFAVDGRLQQAWIRDRTEFHCPNGHPQMYGETRADRLQRELDAKVKLLAAAEQAAETERRIAGTILARAKKAEATAASLKRRTDHGVCPHCARTVRQMAAHIKTKHPDVLTGSASA